MSDPQTSPTPPAAPVRKPAPQRVTVPAETYDRLRLWSGLLVAIAVSAPALLIALGTPDVTHDHEASALIRSRETWQRIVAGVPLAWLAPVANGEPALDAPPLTVWLHIAAWWDLNPATASADILVLRARLVTFAAALLALGATFWAGMSVSGVRAARLAAMALGTTLLFIHESRYAGSEVVLLAWTTLAIAASLWAVRPLKPINWVGRRVLGWLLGGLAMAAAIMTAGPIAMLFILPPIIAAILLTPFRRMGNSLGLTFAVILGALAVSPWYLYIIDQVPGGFEMLVAKYSAPRDLFLLSWSHGRAVAMLSPWQVWLVGALCQPFLRAQHEERRQLLIAWFWFVVLSIVLSIPAAQDPRFLTPILPAAALLVGQLWAYHARLAGERLEDPGVNLLRVPHWLLLCLASIAGPLVLALQEYLMMRGALDEPLLPGLPWSAWAALGAVLLIIALLGTRWHFKWRPRAAAYATVAWMMVASCVCLWSYAHAPQSRYEPRRAVAELAREIGEAQVAYLYRNSNDRPPEPVFLFYFGRPIRPVTPQQLDELRQSPQPTFILARGDEISRELLIEHGYAPAPAAATNLPQDVDPGRQLYVAVPAR